MSASTASDRFTLTSDTYGDVDITVPGQGQRVVPEDDPHVLAARACFTTFGDEGPRKLREEARGRGPRGLLR